MHEQADGVRIVLAHRPFAGIAIANADCPVIVVIGYSNKTRTKPAAVALLHAGLKNLIASDGPSIIEAYAPTRAASSNLHLTFWVSSGIGPCCYGCDAETIKLVTARHGDASISKCTRGPRTGKASVDLYTLARNLLMDRFPQARIIIDPMCTACAIDTKGHRALWSNVYDGKSSTELKRRGRNLTTLLISPLV